MVDLWSDTAPSESGDVSVSKGEIVWVGVEGDADIAGIDPVVHTGRSRALAVVALICAAALAATLAGGARSQVDDRSPDDAQQSGPVTVAPVRSAAPVTTAATTTTLPGVPLPPAPLELVEGFGVAWVGVGGELVMHRLDTGDRIETPSWSDVPWPPLPADVRLLGSHNQTFVVDPAEPSRSGRIARTVRVVRFGEGLDSYGFITTGEGGGSEFYAGSLWGAAGDGLAATDERTTVITIADRGVIVSAPDATSSYLTLRGFVEFPSRLGRVVVATSDAVGGVHCDGFTRCEGRIAGWDGSEEVTVPANLLRSPVLALSPDRTRLFSGDDDRWRIRELDAATSLTVSGDGAAPSSFVAWSEDSAFVAWVEDDRVVIADASTGVQTATAMAFVDEDRPSDGTDVMVFRLVSKS
ncbi:MAG: hypothetical protein ACR2P0_05575 [Acidimicrobiales bacterium]